MLVPRAYGFDLYYPVAWTNNPTTAAVDSGPALQIHGDRGYSVPPGDLLVADFETAYPSGWTTTSFSGYTNPFNLTAGPSQSAWGHTLTGPLGNGRADSYAMGAGKLSNAYRGMLSGTFTAQKHYLNLLVGGGNYPTLTYVDLKDASGKILYTATGAQSTTLSWVTWDLSAYAGQTLTVEIVDNSSDSYGFIACDEIVQSDSNTPATRYGADLTAQKSVVTRWGDWNVDFNLGDDSGLATDVAMARGVPFTWSIWKGGLKPRIAGLSGVALLNKSGNTIRGGASIPNASAVNMGGGTLSVVGGSQEGAGAIAGGANPGGANTVGLGALTLAANATLDFDSVTNGNVLAFANGTNLGASRLTIANWTNTNYNGTTASGQNTDDRLIFAQDMSGNLSAFNFGAGAGVGVSEIALGGGFYEVGFVAVPEPATWVAGFLLFIMVTTRILKHVRLVRAEALL